MTHDPFTDEEHHARAMLMGRKYRAERGYYYIHGRDEKNSDRIDAITLEPVAYEDRMRRLRAGKERYYD